MVLTWMSFVFIHSSSAFIFSFHDVIYVLRYFLFFSSGINNLRKINFFPYILQCCGCMALQYYIYSLTGCLIHFFIQCTFIMLLHVPVTLSLGDTLINNTKTVKSGYCPCSVPGSDPGYRTALHLTDIFLSFSKL